jgi:hypothetical protein
MTGIHFVDLIWDVLSVGVALRGCQGVYTHLYSGSYTVDGMLSSVHNMDDQGEM